MNIDGILDSSAVYKTSGADATCPGIAVDKSSASIMVKTLMMLYGDAEVTE